MKYALEWIERGVDPGVEMKDLARRFGLSISNARCYLCAEKIGDARWHMGVVNNSQEIVHTACFDAEAEKQKKILEVTVKEVAIKPHTIEYPEDFFSSDKLINSSRKRPEPVYTDVRREGVELHDKVHAGDSVQAGESGEHHQRHVSGQKPPSTFPRSGSFSFRGFRYDGEGQ